MSAGKKVPHADALEIANHIVDAISPYCERVEIAGSLRRKRPMVGDIEIVALPLLSADLFGEPLPDAPTPLDRFLEQKRVRFVKNGARYKQFQYGKFTVDLFLPESAAHWGAVYFIRTGSHDFNMWVMTQQQKRAGVQFKDGRLYDWQMRPLVTPEETDVFEALGMAFVPPEDRDGDRWLAYIRQGVVT